jgi:hypothetical protein
MSKKETVIVKGRERRFITWPRIHHGKGQRTQPVFSHLWDIDEL